MYGHPQMVRQWAAAVKPPAKASPIKERCRNCELLKKAEVRAVMAEVRLSPREQDILLRIARGQKLTEIGKALFRSVKTISSHRANLLVKLGLETNADLVRFVIQHGLDEEGAK